MGGYVFDPYSGTMKYDPFAAGDSGMPAPQTSSMPPMMAGASAPQPQPEYKSQVPDVMTGLNKVVDGFFGSSRSPSGSFDPNRVESIISKLPAEQQEEARLKFALAKEQSDLFNKSRPNTSNFNLGNIFQGLGAVAYMTSKNPQVWSHSQAALNRMYQGNEDREKSARAYDMAGMKAYSDVLGDLGDSAADTMRKKREKRDAAVAGAAAMVRKASPENQAAVMEAAAAELEMQGYDVEAREFRRRAKQMGGAAPAPQAGSPTAGNVVLGSEPAYEGVRGTQRVTPANPSDPGQVGTPGYSPQPMSAGQSIYGRHEPRVRELLRKRNFANAVGGDSKAYDDEITTIGNIVQKEMEPGRALSPDERLEVLTRHGVDPQSDAGKAYILTGKLPREDQQSLTATDKKAILEADEMVSTNIAAIEGLRAAKGLSRAANQGIGASTRGWIGNNLPDYLVPDFLSSPESSDATVQYDNAIVSQALPSLKAIFGGNPTEGERKLLLELQGSSSLPRKSREDIIDRAMMAAEKRLKFNEERAAALRGGTFYKDGYSARQSIDPASAPQGRTSVPPPPAVGEQRDGYRFKGGDPSDQRNWERM